MSDPRDSKPVEDRSFGDQLDELRRLAEDRKRQLAAEDSAPATVSPRAAPPKVVGRTAEIVAMARAAAERAARDPRIAAEESRRAREAAPVAAPAVVPARYAWATFDAPDLAARVASKAALSGARRAVGAPIVILTGPSGSGKTSLVAAMLRARMAAERWSPWRVLFAESWALERANAGHPLGEPGWASLVEQAITRRLVVIDDMGSEKSAPQPAVAEVINVRFSAARPTWITTWMTPQQMADRYGDGIRRRVFGRDTGAVWLDCGAKP
ncbi:MAG TPA: hypothetical protein VK841_09485 [Polyangiaceae bacterium]|jgi:DNA replication protein DnaC|nr:hypothetical protein [Polyangiaceae bacterium]